MFDPNVIVGLPLNEAEELANAGGFSIRVMCEDGEHLFGTCDYDTQRINVSTQDGIILPGFDFG